MTNGLLQHLCLKKLGLLEAEVLVDRCYSITKSAIGTWSFKMEDKIAGLYGICKV
jgi:hypothetical protein